LTEGKTVDGGTSEPQLAFVNRGLFSDHFLQARLPEWKEWKIDTELVAFHESLRSLYDSKKPILPHLNEAQTELEFVQPVLDLLGYADSYIVQAPTKVGQHTNRPDYALFPDVKTKNNAYQKLDQNDYSLCIGIADAKYWERELDIAKSSDRDTFTNQNPSFQVAAYLTGTKQNWGILTNGRLWRLYSSKSHLPLGNYYQVDIVKLLEEAPIENLKYFYVLFRKQALLQVEGKSLLDRILEGSEEYAVELEADIKERAYYVVELLCRGFAAEFTHAQLTDAALKSIYDNSLTLLYRLLFVFYAEARELLPLTANASYRENYSLRRLTHDIDETMKKGYELSTSSTQYYHYIGSLFSLINNGDPKLGIPEYNGGLFDPTEHPFLEAQAISDAYLVRAIHQLARIIDKKLGREVAVDYNTLSERHLGSIYEGLLEFKPMIAPHDLVTIKDKGSIKYAPAKKHPGKKIVYTKGELYLANDKGERKASGSYYTPEYIVNYIVENTLDPLVEEAHEKVKTLKPEVDKAIAKWQNLKEQKQGLEPTEKYDRKIVEESERLLGPYLLLKVLDPAMGSGHFLARATDFLAEAIATDPEIKSPLELTEESELTYYRRRVVESCIYGVDLNPLAVELAKLTLWLTTMAKSKPLSFLNHHLRVGNSLIGARIADLDEIPKAKGKKKAFDPSRAPVQLGLFQEAFNKKLYDLLQNRALIAQLPTETLENVHNKQKLETEFEHNTGGPKQYQAPFKGHRGSRYLRIRNRIPQDNNRG
jgi:type I restriction-modification system DNA methylase subunit